MRHRKRLFLTYNAYYRNYCNRFLSLSARPRERMEQSTRGISSRASFCLPVEFFRVDSAIARRCGDSRDCAIITSYRVNRRGERLLVSNKQAEVEINVALMCVCVCVTRASLICAKTYARNYSVSENKFRRRVYRD